MAVKYKVKSPVMQFDVIEVDAEMAEFLLSFNKEHEQGVAGTNRKASNLKIDEWAYMMVAGEWILIHQGIAFSKSGELIDGQHRLKAVLRANELTPGIKVKFVIAVGCDRDTYKVIDQGMRRRLSDLLTSQGIMSATRMASALKLLYCYENIHYINSVSWHKPIGFTPNAMEQTLREWPEIHEGTIKAQALARIANQTAMAVGYALALRYRPDLDIDAFFQILIDGTGEGVGKGNPPFELRETLIRVAKSSATSSNRVHQLGLFIKAFNRWAEGGTVDSLRFSLAVPKGDKNAESFPRIAIPRGL